MDLLTVHVQQAGMASKGRGRTLLQYGFGSTDRYTQCIMQALQHLEGGKRRSANPVSELVHAVYHVATAADFDVAGLTVQEFRHEMSVGTPLPLLDRTNSGDVAPPKELMHAVTLPERIDLAETFGVVTELAAIYSKQGVVGAAEHLWKFMQLQHDYMLPSGEFDLQLLQMHALQNAVAVVRPTLFEAMRASVNCDEDDTGAARVRKPWLPHYANIDAFMVQACPQSLVESDEDRINAGMSAAFATSCAIARMAGPSNDMPATFSGVEKNTIMTITDEVQQEIHSRAVEDETWESLNAIKVWRGVATLYVIEHAGETCGVAVYNWHAARSESANHAETVASASKYILDAMRTVVLGINSRFGDNMLGIVVGDVNLVDATDSAAAADHLHDCDLEMFNSARPDGSNKCCRVTVNRNAPTMPMSTRWGTTNAVKTVAMGDVIICPVDKGPFDIGATVFTPGEATPRDDFVFDHCGLAFTVTRRSEAAIPTQASRDPPAIVATTVNRYKGINKIRLLRIANLFFLLWLLCCAYEMFEDYYVGGIM